MNVESPYQALIASLNDDGLATPSKKLNMLLCDVAWTTISEFLGAFGSEMEKTKREYWDRMSETTQSAFGAAAEVILKTWPALKI